MTDTRTPVQVEVHAGMDAVRTALDTGLGDLVGPEQASPWSVDREFYRPELRVASQDGHPVAAVLTTGRPATAATTLVEPWWTSAPALEGLVGDVADSARRRGDVALKWSTTNEIPEVAIDVGFMPLAAPLGAVGTEGVRGAVRWLADIPHREPGYYAQTTMFTCGAVAALMGAPLRDAHGFAGDGDDRARELEYWRRASNYPACEPVGLAVATAEYLGTRAIEIALDAESPVLVEGYDNFDLSFRTELQAESRRRASQLGLVQRSERVAVAEIARRVADGDLALLLIDEAPMHGEHGPHWVLAHASDGSEVVIVEDPWVNRDTGETWVDTHELPIALADLDRLVRWSDDGYRGVVFIGR